MFADNDNDYPSDYFMPKPDPWRWVWLVLIFSVPLMLLVALVRVAFGYI